MLQSLPPIKVFVYSNCLLSLDYYVRVYLYQETVSNYLPPYCGSKQLLYNMYNIRSNYVSMSRVMNINIAYLKITLVGIVHTMRSLCLFAKRYRS